MKAKPGLKRTLIILDTSGSMVMYHDEVKHLLTKLSQQCTDIMLFNYDNNTLEIHKLDSTLINLITFGGGDVEVILSKLVNSSYETLLNYNETLYITDDPYLAEHIRITIDNKWPHTFTIHLMG